MHEEIEKALSKLSKAPLTSDEFEKYCAKRKLILSCPVIQVAGSIGKSCLVHYLESIYLAAGYRVGAFFSSSLDGLQGMVRFGGENIPSKDLLELFHKNEKDLNRFGLTYFQASVALAYRYFEEKKPDLVIVETGLGGALDPTNLETLDTRLSIIASVSMDNTAELGTTLSQIALHAAGIIKPQAPVLVGNIDTTTLDTIREEALKQKSTLYRVEAFHFEHLVEGKFHFDYGPYKDVVLGTDASYQVINASLAIEATRLLQNDFPVTEEAVRAGLGKPNLPVRFERFGRVMLDAAHNPESAEALARCARTIGQGKPVHVLFASLREKNIAVELPTLANAVYTITLTTFDHPLARDGIDFMIYADDHPFEEDAWAALGKLLAEHPEDAILVTGSFEFVGMVRQRIETEGLPA
ncbi:MAG: hypothetical protein K6E59_03665 [Bacilli bacterium]|nr:hypothetical protein [Bacilli bacterium]